MLYIELPKRPAPPELFAIQDPDQRYEKLSAFYASVGFERLAVPREIEAEGPAAVQGFVEGQAARLAAEVGE